MRRALNSVLVLLVALTITVLSFYPGEAAGATGGASYLGHFAAYFLLAGSLLLYFADTGRGHVEAVAVAAAFGLCVEMVQFGLPFRTFSLVDASVNLAGASVVLLDHRSRAVTRILEMEDKFIEESIGLSG